MGWFSPKTITTVKSISMRMLDDKAFKPSGQQAAHWIQDTHPLSPMFDRPKLSDYLIEYANNSLPNQYNKLYKFAKKPSNYVFGLPSASVITDPKNSLLNATYKHLGISKGAVKDGQVGGSMACMRQC